MQKKLFKKKAVILFACLSIMSVSLLTGCNDPAISSYEVSNDFGSRTESVKMNKNADMIMDNNMSSSESFSESYSDSSYEAPSSSGSSSNDTLANQVKNTMMIIRNADISLDVKNLDEFTDNLNNKVNQYNGYFESTNINNYANEWSTERYGYYTVRIPSDKLDEFLDYAKNEGSITNKQITSEDVSLEYIDVEAHISALQSERDHLNELMEQTANVSEIIEVEDRLSDVQARLDSYVSQKKSLENRVSYSTIHINACENREVEHPFSSAFNINIKERFMDGLVMAATLFINVLASVPVIIILTVFVLLFIWIIRKVWRIIFPKKDNVPKIINNIPKNIENFTENYKNSEISETENNNISEKSE